MGGGGRGLFNFMDIQHSPYFILQTRYVHSSQVMPGGINESDMVMSLQVQYLISDWQHQMVMNLLTDE